MAKKNDSEERLPVINFRLDKGLYHYMDELKSYYNVRNNNDMTRLCISMTYRAMIKEKKELGLSKEE